MKKNPEFKNVNDKINKLLLLNGPHWVVMYLTDPQKTLNNLCTMENIANPIRLGKITRENVEKLFQENIVLYSKNSPIPWESMNAINTMTMLNEFIRNMPVSHQFEMTRETLQTLERLLENSLDNTIPAPARRF